MIRKNIKLKKQLVNITNIFLFFILSFLNYFIFYNNSVVYYVDFLLDIYANIGIIMLLWTVIMLNDVNRELSLTMIVLVMLYFMAYGQIWTRYFDIPVLKAIDVFKYESHVSILKAISYSQICFHFMFCMAYYKISKYKKTTDIETTNKKDNRYSDKNFITIGIILLIIGLVPAIYNDGLTIVSTIRKGYSLSNVDRSGIWDDLSMFLRPAYFMLMAGLYKNKRTFFYRFTYCTAILWESLLMLLGGTRGLQITMLIALYWLDKKLHFGTVRIKFKEILIIFTSMTVLGVITAFRKTPINLWNISTIIYSLFENNYVVQLIAEFGSTLQTLVIAINIIPNQISFKYGLSFILAPIMLAPNIGGVINSIADSLFANRIIRMYTTHNIGGSFVAELYLNFGQIGFLFAGIFAAWLAKLSKLTLVNGTINKMNFVMTAGLISTIPFIARASLSEIVRVTFIRVFIPYFLINFLSKNKLYNS